MKRLVMLLTVLLVTAAFGGHWLRTAMMMDTKTNLIPNGGFETIEWAGEAAPTNQVWQQKNFSNDVMQCAGWAHYRVNSVSDFNHCGIIGKKSTTKQRPPGYFAPYQKPVRGDYAACMASNNGTQYFRTTVMIPTSGYYDLSLWTAMYRNPSSTYTVGSVKCSLYTADNKTLVANLYTFTNRPTSWHSETNRVYISEGAYTFRVSLNNNRGYALIDDIVLTPAD